MMEQFEKEKMRLSKHAQIKINLIIAIMKVTTLNDVRFEVFFPSSNRRAMPQIKFD